MKRGMYCFWRVPKEAKVAAQKAKPKLDQLNLQLQNLLYERNYYMKEIRGCKDFKPKHEVSDLIDIEQFLEKAPEWNKTEPTQDSPVAHHKFMLQRLQFELQERKRFVSNIRWQPLSLTSVSDFAKI